MTTDLGRAVEAILTGGIQVPDTLGGRLAAVERAAGSQSAAARATGVGEATWRRWKTGVNKPSASNLDKLVQAARAVIVKPRTIQEQFVIKVTDRGTNRKRRLDAGNLKMAPGTLEAAGRVYARTGNADAAAAVVMDGVRDPFYQRWLSPVAPDPQDFQDLDLAYEGYDWPDGDYGAAAAGPG